MHSAYFMGVRNLFSTEKKHSGSVMRPITSISMIYYLNRKERIVLFNNTLNTFNITVIWHQTYGKGPFR